MVLRDTQGEEKIWTGKVRGENGGNRFMITGNNTSPCLWLRPGIDWGDGNSKG